MVGQSAKMMQMKIPPGKSRRDVDNKLTYCGYYQLLIRKPTV